MARLMDIAGACSRSGEPRFTRFLEPPEQRLAARAAAEAGVCAALYGGYDGAERQVAAFSQDKEIEDWQWPICCLRISWNEKYTEPSHRDLLGALMAQGIERNTTGDIAMGMGCAYLFTLPEMAGYLSANLESAGRAKLVIEEVGLREVELQPPKGHAFRVTVPSMRLDALVAEGYNISRAQAQALIGRGLVKQNHLEQSRADARVVQGDLLSVRGYGRLKILEEQGGTKKGRIGLLLFKYKG